jgi:protein-disulfide isomerase
MTMRAALRAAVLAAAQALLGGCGGSTAAAPSTAPNALGAPGVEAIDVDAFAERIEPSRIPLASAELPSRGPVSAPVTIHLFSDFECPYCALVPPLLREIETEFGGNVRTVWHNFPLPHHPHAELAAVAGVLVYRARGGAAFWRFHDAVFEAAPRSGLDQTIIEYLASQEGVPPTHLRAAVSSGADGRVAADVAAGDAAGVEGTPAFFVNDRMVTGTLPYPEFRALIQRALAEARAPR